MKYFYIYVAEGKHMEECIDGLNKKLSDGWEIHRADAMSTGVIYILNKDE